MFKMYDRSANMAPVRRWITRGLCLVLLIACGSTSAADADITEIQIKAAMLYKFLGYTEWPEAAFPEKDTPYRIWLLDSHQVGDELRAITSERGANGRAIKVFKTRSFERIQNPHVVFVGQNAERYLPRLTQMAEAQGFLIVTENSRGLPSGSTINLRLLNDRIGFDVSLTCAQRNQLKLSARLLSVASTVEQDSPR